MYRPTWSGFQIASQVQGKCCHVSVAPHASLSYCSQWYTWELGNSKWIPPPLKCINPEQKDTSALCVLPYYFFLEHFFYHVWLCPVLLPTSLPDLAVAPQGLPTKLLDRYFNWTSRYRNKKAAELFFCLPVSLMSSTLSQCNIWGGNSPCATHLFKKEIPPQTFRNAQILPSPVGFCRSWFALQWKLLQMSLSKGAKDRALILPGICQLFVCPYTLKFSSSLASSLRPWSWQAQNICPLLEKWNQVLLSRNGR